MKTNVRRQLLITVAALFLIQGLCVNSAAPDDELPADNSNVGGGEEVVVEEANIQEPEVIGEDTQPSNGNEESYLIGDFVWEDLNENGVQDEGEPGLANVQVVLLSTSGEVLADTLTDEDGAFSFSVSGEDVQYQIRVVSPEGYSVTSLEQGGDETKDNNANADELTELFSAASLSDLGSVDIGFVPAQVAAELCPLTGEVVAEGELGLAPLAISLSHFPPLATRPPTGLTWAPWVFELYTGEGQTRLLSLFYCGFGEMEEAIETQQVDTGLTVNDVRIEGVRSGRVIYGNIAKYFAAAIIQGGSDQTNVAPAIQELVCANAYGSDPDDIGSGGMSIERLLRLAEECRDLIGERNLASYLFDASPPSGGQEASELLMFYNIGNQTQWVYDADLGGYVRYQNGANSQAEFETFTVSTDRLTDDAIVRENVIVMGVEHIALNGDETIFDLVNFDFSIGPAKLFRNGIVYDICWNTLNTEPNQKELQPVRFTDCNGNSIALAPGSTWVNVVNLGDQFLQEVSPGVWKARFSAPSFQAN
ncbi:MAG: DUF3048 domain-containing protein [Chloroflexi bacterium]|nr:MAG: DUF3048 domain-containing protein [Chloroflexota bacterium]MBL1194046.1 DUF3048 domain-containing protein [Chloroflexota bacterium]NOH11340.1 hypothetical protein [Chloroflexota bacterium]